MLVKALPLSALENHYWPIDDDASRDWMPEWSTFCTPGEIDHIDEEIMRRPAGSWRRQPILRQIQRSIPAKRSTNWQKPLVAAYYETPVVVRRSAGWIG